MRAIVEIRWGPLRGEKAVLAEGASIRVGRTERADLVVAHDRQMAALHFELRWDGVTCQLEPLTAEPLSLNGQRAAAGVVAHGDWIKAGETIFVVYFEEHTRPRRNAGAEMTPAKERALAVLEEQDRPLFAVLDAARADRILEVVRESVEDYRSLYEGTKGEALSDVAPHLVSLPRGSRLLQRLVREGWGKRWGMYLTCERPFKEVRTHLRRFLMVVNDEDGKRMYFRYYDPATLRVFLPSCAVRQSAELFGPIHAFLLEGEDGELIRFDSPLVTGAPDRAES